MARESGRRWLRGQDRKRASATRRLRLEVLEARDLLAVDLVTASITGGSGNAISNNSAVSANGRYVVFESFATNLTGNSITPSIQNIFRRDTQNGVTELVSVSTSNTGGNDSSSQPVISADGRYVAFSSLASNLAANDTNFGVQDVFVRDMNLGITTLVSLNTTGGSGNAASSSPSISDDGRFIAFTSLASNLAANDTNGTVQDVFVRDRVAPGTTLISVTTGGAASGNRPSSRPVVSGNGMFVAFDSEATDLVANDTNGTVPDVFVRGVAAGPTVLVSINRDNNGSGNGASTVPSISSDGQVIAFVSSAFNLTFNDFNGFQDVFVRNRTTSTTTLASATPDNLTSGNQPSGSALVARGGGHVVFVSTANNLVTNDFGSTSDVFVRTLATNSTALVSVATTGFSGNSHSDAPSISADGRYVAFASQASNLITNDLNGVIHDVFRRDLAAGMTTLVSFNVFATGSANSASFDPSISDDGQSISFSSQATDLVLNDPSSIQDIFFFGTSSQILVTAPDFGGSPHVRVLDARNGGLKFQFFPYAFAFTGGVRVATGDVNMDGVADIVTAAGPGGGPHVRVFSGVDGQQLPGAIGSFFPYAGAFTGGVFVATADVNRDGRADIITGADAGGGPHVRVFNAVNGAPLFEIFPYAFAFTGGVRVAGGDINADGFPDIITAAGPGGGPHVRVFSGQNGSVLREFFAYTGAFSNGVYVSAGDINVDGRADIITGPGQGGGPHVRVFSGLDNADLLNVFAFDPNFTGGVRVASADVNNDGRIDVVAGTGPGTQARVRAFSGVTGALIADALAYPGFPNGIFVAGSKTGASGGSPSLPFGPASTSYRGLSAPETVGQTTSEWPDLDEPGGASPIGDETSDPTGDALGDLSARLRDRFALRPWILESAKLREAIALLDDDALGNGSLTPSLVDAVWEAGL